MTQRTGLPTLAELTEAWHNVSQPNGGPVSPSLVRFAEDADTKLAQLATTLADGTYRPRPLTEVVLAEDDHDRVLHIPAVADRVVERALLNRVLPLVDPWLGEFSYAYRPGLSVGDAVRAVAAQRDEGGRWVLRTDIDDCFPSIPREHALRTLDALVPWPETRDLIRALAAREARTPEGQVRWVTGVAQGCALSPMLANLVLVAVDDALAERGFRPVRYADDVTIVTDSPDDAWEAARIMTAALDPLGMRLGADKTAVMSFDEGFAFLGEEFTTRYPPLLDGHKVDPPDRRTLYVARQGARVRMEAGRILVTTKDEVDELSAPSGLVRRIVLFGSVGLSAGTRSWAVGHDVDVVLVSRRGSYLGSIVPAASPSRAARLKAQVRATADDSVAVRTASALVEAKVLKQIVVLRHFGRREHAEQVADAVRSMRAVLRLLPECTTADGVRGIEGAAAAAYFPAYGALMPDGMAFTTRSRRPPLDLANATMSYLYAVLLGECESALRAAGLDPCLGFLHADDDNRPSLALDLMEEFRPLVVDQCVLAAARRNRLTLAHARTDTDRAGVLLTKEGIRLMLSDYENRMLQFTRGALPGFAGTLRRHLYRQAQRMAATIAEPDTPWTGLSWR